MKIEVQFRQTIEIDNGAGSFIKIYIEKNNNIIMLELTPGEAYIIGTAIRLAGQWEMDRKNDYHR